MICSTFELIIRNIQTPQSFERKEWKFFFPPYFGPGCVCGCWCECVFTLQWITNSIRTFILFSLRSTWLDCFHFLLFVPVLFVQFACLLCANSHSGLKNVCAKIATLSHSQWVTLYIYWPIYTHRPSSPLLLNHPPGHLKCIRCVHRKSYSIYWAIFLLFIGHCFFIYESLCLQFACHHQTLTGPSSKVYNYFCYASHAASNRFDWSNKRKHVHYIHWIFFYDGSSCCLYLKHTGQHVKKKSSRHQWCSSENGLCAITQSPYPSTSPSKLDQEESFAMKSSIKRNKCQIGGEWRWKKKKEMFYRLTLAIWIQFKWVYASQHPGNTYSWAENTAKGKRFERIKFINFAKKKCTIVNKTNIYIV